MAGRLVIGCVCGLAGITHGAAVRRQVPATGGVQTLNGVNFAPTKTATPALSFNTGVVQFNTGFPLVTPTPTPTSTKDATKITPTNVGGNLNTTSAEILNLNGTALNSTGVLGGKNDTNTTRRRCFGSAQYDIVVDFEFPAVLQALFQQGIFFGPLVVVSHGKKGAVWKNGTMASDSLKKYIMTGATEDLQELEMSEKPTAHRVIAFDSTRSLNGTVEGSIEVNETSSLFSALSRLQPSTNFFAGASDAELCDMKKGTWERNLTLNIYLYDSGITEIYAPSLSFESPVAGSGPTGEVNNVVDGVPDGVGSFDDTFVNPAQTAPAASAITPSVMSAQNFPPSGSVAGSPGQFIPAPAQSVPSTRQRRQQQQAAAPVGVSVFPSNPPASGSFGQTDPSAQSNAALPAANGVTFMPPATNQNPSNTGGQNSAGSTFNSGATSTSGSSTAPVTSPGTSSNNIMMPMDGGLSPSTDKPITLVAGSKDEASSFYGLPKKIIVGTVQLYLTKTCVSFPRPGKKTANEKKPAGPGDMLPPFRDPPRLSVGNSPGNTAAENTTTTTTTTTGPNSAPPMSVLSTPQQPGVSAQQQPQTLGKPQAQPQTQLQGAPIAQPVGGSVSQTGPFSGSNTIPAPTSFNPAGANVPPSQPPTAESGAGQTTTQVSTNNKSQVVTGSTSMPPSGVVSMPSNQNAGSAGAIGGAANGNTVVSSNNPMGFTPQPVAGGNGPKQAAAAPKQGQFRSFGSDQMVFIDFRN